MKISTFGLTKQYGDKRVLSDINLEILPHRINMFVGPNGSGKTTIFKILSFIEEPTSGKIYYDNKEYYEVRSNLNFRRRITMTTQPPFFFNTTVFNNLIYPLKIRKMTTPLQPFDEIIELTKLTEIKEKKVSELSSGEKQRLAIARAIIFSPDVIFFDEPTANIDPINKVLIEKIFLLLKEKKKTIVISTHNLSDVSKIADKIFLLYNGAILQSGTPQEIFSKPVSVEVADFTGTQNIFQGKLHNNKIFVDDFEISVVDDGSGDVYVTIRPEDILISLEHIHSSARNCIKGKIFSIKAVGVVVELDVMVGKTKFHSIITKQSFEEMSLEVGKDVFLVFKATSVNVIKCN